MFIWWLIWLCWLGIKKLILYLLSIHAFLVCLIAMLLLLFVLVLEFRKRHRFPVYNLDSPFEPSLAPGIWVLASTVVPELKDVELPGKKYKIGRLCWN